MKLTKRQALSAYVALRKSNDYDDDTDHLREVLEGFLTGDLNLDSCADEDEEDEDEEDDDCGQCGDCSDCECDEEEDLDEEEDDDEDEDEVLTACTPAVKYNVVSSTQLKTLKALKVQTVDGFDTKLSFDADEDGVYSLNDGQHDFVPVSRIAVSVADKQIEVRLPDAWEVYTYTKLPKSWAALFVGSTNEYTVFGVQNDDSEDEDE